MGKLYAALVILSILSSLLIPANSYGATFNVSTTAQFRKALEDASVNGTDDMIILEAGTYKTTDDGIGTFKFSDKEAHALTIKAKDGLTADNVILDGANTHPVINLTNTQNSVLTLDRISIKNGKSGGKGGGISASDPISLNIKDCVISDSTANNGGGIYGFRITVTNSTISGNSAAYGGGIYNDSKYYYETIGKLTVTNSTITDNTTINFGGAIEQGGEFGEVMIANSTVSSNIGTGIYVGKSSPATILNSVVANNSRNGVDGYYYINGYWREFPTVIVVNSVIANNNMNGIEGGGTYINNIFLDNKSDISFSVDSNIYNNYIDYTKLTGESSLTIVKKNNIQPSDGDINFSDASFRLGANSIVINKGLDPNSDIFKNLITIITLRSNISDLLKTDKDSNKRVVGSAIDLGPYEYGSSTTLPPTPTQTSVISLPRTGQTISHMAGDDASVQAGVAWPSPRFSDNGDGTAIDNLTGLMWTSDANAPGPSACSPGTPKIWEDALDYVVCLNTSKYLGYSDWRLPNILELNSLIDRSQYGHALPVGHPFYNIYSFKDFSFYWSSTSKK